jgi:hypothetical protein
MSRRLWLAALALLALVAGCGKDAGCTGGPITTPTASPASVPASPSATVTATPSPTQPAPTARFDVARGKVVAGPRTVEVKVGDRVVLEVVTDTEDELHVHGYDKEVALNPGKPARITFTADIAGVFEGRAPLRGAPV